jgi:hypothetical protein
MAHRVGLTFDPSEHAREPILVHCSVCGHEWSLGFAPMDIETFSKVGRQPCLACGKRPVMMGPRPKPTPAGDWRAWITNGDTGISSETIWTALSGTQMTGGCWRPGTPIDASDFGRCYRLLQVMPEWRARIGEVADRYPAWRPMAEAWEELTALYEAEVHTGMCERLYARMRELRGEA